MFGILKNVYNSVVQPCTRNFFHGLLDNPRVEEICAALAENEKAYEEGRKTKKEHDDFKAKHKSLLPAFLLQGTPKDGRRKSQAGYIPTGLAMMDYDRLPRPQEYFEQKIRPLLERPDIRICWGAAACASCSASPPDAPPSRRRNAGWASNWATPLTMPA